MSLLTVQGLSLREKGNLVVKDIDFRQAAFEKIGIAGETGSGKTSLLKMIAGLAQPDSGSVSFNNERVLGPFEKLLPGHPGIAYLSQQFELPNHFWVNEILESVNQLTEGEAERLYTICRVSHLLRRRTDQLSGGEKQRIALARLLSTSPKLLLLDEPYSNLDNIHKNIIKSVIHDISGQLGISCILVSHDAADILSWADRIMVMKDGSFIQQGGPQQLYQQPVDEYCAALFGEYNLLDPGNPAFSALQDNEAGGRKRFLRPEEFEIVTERDYQLSGTAEELRYHGSHYILGVKSGGALVRVKSDTVAFQPGDKIYLSVKAKGSWWI